MAQRHQQFVDQFELPLGLFRTLASDIVEDGRELTGDDIGQEFRSAALERQHVRAAKVNGRDRSSQAFGEQQVIETIW